MTSFHFNKASLDADQPIGPRGENGLAFAATGDDIEGVRKSLARGCSVRHKDQDGTTALVRAVYYSSPEILKLLLEADPGAVAEADLSPFTLVKHLLAASREDTQAHLEKLALLVEAGAELETMPPLIPPLCDAMAGKRLLSAQMLLEAGASVFCGGRPDVSAISSAAGSGFTEGLGLLKSHGGMTRINQRHGPEKLSALHVAVRKRQHAAARWLLAEGAFANTLDCRAVTPLHDAAENRDAPMMRLLVEKGGADVNKIENPCEYTALHTSVFRMDADTVRELLALGADPHQPDDIGRTPLQMAAWKGSLECLRLLMEEAPENPDPQKAMQARIDALYEAVFYGHHDVAAYLVGKGVALNRQNSHNEFILNACVQQRSPLYLDMLLAAGADPNVKDKFGMSPLMLAAQRGLIEEAQMLIAKGANPDIDGGFGRPLHAAVLKDQAGMVKVLAQAGANPFLKDEHGHTPRELAVLRQKTALIPLLEEAEKTYVYKKSFYAKINPPKIP